MMEQEWKGMDGAIAFHLIDRHAEDWAHTGKMMREWREANESNELEQLRQRVAELEEERDAALTEVALLKPNPLCDMGCMLSCKMEADYYEKEITTMKTALREALACGEDGDWQSARRIINTALGEEK